MILADDLGVADVNSFDPLDRTFYETPNLDRLAGEGMKFLAAYTNAANCSPTRAAMLSGQYYPNQPIYHVGRPGNGRTEPGEMISANNADELPLDKITDAEMLQKAGYSTALIGKWHVGNSPEFGPQQQGYEVNIGGSGAGNPSVWEGGYFEPNNNSEIDDAEEGEYLTNYLGRKAVEFITNNREGPFYLNLSFYTPHYPLQAPDHIVEKYRQKEPDRGHCNAEYAAMIESMDRNVGKIVDTLDELDIADNTVIFFMSDNGGIGGYEYIEDRPESDNILATGVTDNRPYKGGKTTYYEGGIRTPLIVRWPGVIEAGSSTSEPVIGIDLYPTYLELAGMEPPEDYKLDGLAFNPLFENPAVSLNREALYWHFPGYPNSRWRTGPVSAVRSGPWKLLKFYETDEVELYNVEDDPGEENDRSDERPEQRDRLHSHLEQWLQQTGAPMPSWPDN
ncbi:MAG: sulfatase [Balneolaceae bacterium]|nr:sulfatase [Balneolaceae bacterium]